VHPAALGASGALPMFVAQLLAFLLLAAILWKFVRPPLRHLLEARSRAIEESFQRLEEETARAARRAVELEQKLARFDEEARALRERRRGEALRASEEILRESRAQAEAAAEKARFEIRLEREKAILELRGRIGDLTLEAAERLAASVMNEAIHERLVENTLRRLDAMERP